MKKTISTHNGNIANRDHNIRNPKVTDSQKHIDKSLLDQNEILHDEKHREAYQRIFGQALAEYNQKQKRPERQIKDYYNHVCKDSKRHPVYEMIIQVGDRSNTGVNAPIERECLKEFYMGWKKRNPNLECIGAYIHADEKEGTLHMHLDYIPVAHGYKKGLSIQNGLVKALKEQGFEKQGKATAQIQWEARENSALEEICNAHGIEISHPERERKEHLSVQQYKQQASIQETTEKLIELKHVICQKERHSKKLEIKEAALSEILKKKQMEIEKFNTVSEKLSQEVKNLEENIFAKKKIEKELDERNEIAMQSIQKDQKELQEIESEKSIRTDELMRIQAKYNAQKVYVEESSKDLDFSDIKPNKGFNGKIKSYTVPAAIWETQKICMIERTAQKKADMIFQQKIHELEQSKQSNKIIQLQEENTTLKHRIEVMEKSLENVSKKTEMYKKDSWEFEAFLRILAEHPVLYEQIEQILQQLEKQSTKEYNSMIL